jgi:predicted ArsR family transcriptional regulator
MADSLKGAKVAEEERDRDIARIEVLGDPVRRLLYNLVTEGAPEPLSREQVAAAAGIRRALAAFHLDKLVASGLLEPVYRRLSGRSGPGAGRTAKLYRRSQRTIEISLPERRHELLAGLLVQVLAEAPEGATFQRARDLGRDLGRRLGEQARESLGTAIGRPRLQEVISNVLAKLGYEPRRGPQGALRMHNCPFQPLAQQYRSTVCQINLALQGGLIEGLKAAPRLQAELTPTPGWCCVTIHGVGKS